MTGVLNVVARLAALLLGLVALAVPGYVLVRTSRPRIEPLLERNDAAPEPGEALIAVGFDRPDGLIVNEYSFWNPHSPRATPSRTWEITSGSLFARDGAGWTGRPDWRRPNARSTNATGSAVFRLRTRRTFGDVSVSFSLRVRRLVTTPKTPVRRWDGIHVFLRYYSPTSLYVASVNRRDNTVVIKKKVPRRSGGGRYYTLGAAAPHRVPFGSWQRVRADAITNSDGSVTITLFADGARLLTATDRGLGGPPLTAPGRVGIRGDNADFLFDDFRVRTLAY